MNKDTFCVLPFTNMTLAPQGFGKSCCIAQDNYRKDDGESWNVNDATIQEMWASESADRLRNDLLNGVKNPNCAFCWKDEETDKISKRLRDNERLQHITDEFTNGRTTPLDSPLSFELSLGIACNLKCRMCSWNVSSMWLKEASDLKIVSEQRLQELAEKSKWANEDKFWDSFREALPHIERMEFYGGEPFLSKQQFEVIGECVNNGYAKNQTIHYNTNCTIYPEDAVLNSWPHFKNVSVMFSIDGVGPQIEYIRHPANWELLQKNMNKMMTNSGDNISFSICYTFGMMNFFYLTDMIEWCIENEKETGNFVNIWLNTMFEPVEFCIRNYPDHVKEIITKKLSDLPEEYYKYVEKKQLDQCLDFMNFENYNNISGFWDKINKHDLYRGELFEATFPELYELMK